jgi:hypothetical protein
MNSIVMSKRSECCGLGVRGTVSACDMHEDSDANRDLLRNESNRINQSIDQAVAGAIAFVPNLKAGRIIQVHRLNTIQYNKDKDPAITSTSTEQQEVLYIYRSRIWPKTRHEFFL